MIESLVQISVPVIFYASPLLLGYVAWQLWVRYIRTKYLRTQKFILLEIKIPKEVTKTPQAMELALNALNQGWDGDNFFTTWFGGQCRAWFSLELVSINGEIHFYIWTSSFFKNLIESQFYAQYPGIEIHEVDDYVHNVPYGLPNSGWKLWGAEFKLGKEDAYPIKTYINYGLDKPTADSDEGAARTDPITATLEYLGSMKPGEQLWLQILVQATKKDWKGQGAALREKLMQRNKKAAGPDDAFPGLTVLSPGERQALEDVERSLTKPGFDCGIRVVYLAKEDVYHPIRVVSNVGMLKQYNSADLNGFRPAWTTSEKYPWTKYITGQGIEAQKAMIFNAYRHRAYFYAPYHGESFVLSAEELATIYHFPGSVAMTPSLAKIGSKRAEPPTNLPV